ncbi:HAD-like protein [Ramaria rubella]|nr:HAD-like protein [Ramaria rubella]
MAPPSALLFDCDNTLVLSEDLAFTACANLANILLTAHALPQHAHYTGPQLMRDFVGQNFRGVLGALQARYGFALTGEEVEEYVRREEVEVIRTFERELVPCKGVREVLGNLTKQPAERTLPPPIMAVVSSSALRRVRASLQKTALDTFFPPTHIFSAASSLPTPTSKPDPAIYLYACAQLGVAPSTCVAVEDSKSGTLSAVRAGIRVVAYVGCYEGERRVEVARELTGLGAGAVMEDWGVEVFRKALEEVGAA